MLVTPELSSTSPKKPGRWNPGFPAILAAGQPQEPEATAEQGPKSTGQGFWTGLCFPVVAALPSSSCSKPRPEGWKCRGHLPTVGRQASEKCQQNPRNTDLNKSVSWFTNRDQNTCSFKLALLRFYLQTDILLPETATGMFPFWRAGQGCRLHPNKPSTHWQHTNAI